MFFDVTRDHGLPINPFKACVVPRPIGWISTRDLQGRENLAPYSFFNAISEEPPMVMVCMNGHHATDGGVKDTLGNLGQVPEFVVNVATWPLRDAVNVSSAPWPHGIDEFLKAGVDKLPAERVRPSRVKQSPIHLECVVHQVVELPAQGDGRNTMVIGCVLGVHIDDSVLSNGRVDIDKLRPIGRLGYSQYVVVSQDNTFSMRRPPYDP